MPKIKRIIIDAMGGDNAPLEILKGTFLAVKEYGIKPVLVGNEEVIKKCAKDNNIALNNTKIVNSNSVISMHDPFSSGSLIFLTICHSEAPSMEAASYKLCGMVLREL